MLPAFSPPNGASHVLPPASHRAPFWWVAALGPPLLPRGVVDQDAEEPKLGAEQVNSLLLRDERLEALGRQREPRQVHLRDDRAKAISCTARNRNGSKGDDCNFSELEVM